MIIEPDFFEHWKTKALIELTKRPESPLWVQRLWAHCHTRKAWEFRDLSNLALKSICGVHADITPGIWKQHLLDAGFVRVKGKSLVVHDWEKHNAGLVQRWNSGKAPKKKRSRSGALSEDKPQGSDRDDRLDREEGLDRMTAAKAAALIYAAYPRQIGKQTALKAIVKALKSHAAAVLLEKTKAYATAVAGQDHQFLPHPSTWFNSGRYEDDPAEWAAPEKNSVGGSAALRVKLTGAPHEHTGGLEVFNEPAAPAEAGGSS